MKKLYPSIFLAAIVISAIAATVKISDLPISTSPSTNTFIEIADMDAVTKSGKYLLTNLVTQSAFTAATNSITTSAANWTASGTTNSTLAGNARVNAIVATNGITAGASTFTASIANTPSAISPSGTNVTVDFSLSGMRTVSLSTNALFAASNLAAGTRVTLRLLCDGTTRNLYWNGSWIPIGAPAPGSIAASKYAECELVSWGTTDAEVTIKYAEQP